jgi:hypothetical protein
MSSLGLIPEVGSRGQGGWIRESQDSAFVCVAGEQPGIEGLGGEVSESACFCL